MTPSSSLVAFIGGGLMSRSLISGLLKSGRAPASIQVSNPHPALREALTNDFAVAAFSDNAHASDGADTWVFAVKPQVMKSVCQALMQQAQAQKPLIVSIAAGITSEQIDRWLGGEMAIVRCMPNTPALLGAGATGLFANARVTPAQLSNADALLKAAGLTVWIDDEAHMDIVTALSGSGPAYVFFLAEAMQAAAEAQGLPADVAQALTRQTIFGAMRLLDESGQTPSELRRQVTTPAGTTHAAITALTSDGFQQLLNRAIAAATERGRELSASHDGPNTSETC